MPAVDYAIAAFATPTSLSLSFPANWNLAFTNGLIRSTNGTTGIAIFAATATTGDFGDPSSDALTLTDSYGNTWNLAFSSVNNLGATSNVYNAIAVYVCDKLAVGGSAILLNMPSDLLPGDALVQWAAGWMVQTSFASLSFDVVDSNGSNPLGDVFSLSQNGESDLVIGGVFASDLTASGVALFSPSSAYTPLPTLLATGFFGTTSGGTNPGTAQVGLASSQLQNKAYSFDIQLDSATDTFAFLLAMSGANNTGGSAAQTLTFSINKGPEPIPPKEERAIATIEIDCTQQPLQTFVNYPELCMLDVTEVTDLAGFTVCNFDLEHLFQGSGLSQVRSLAYWARPLFHLTSEGREDVPTFDQLVYAALLTNTTTLQTVMLGEAVSANLNVQNGQAFGQYGIIPFPANKHSLKYRFILPQYQAATIRGKYTLQFMNFETPVLLSQSGLLANAQD